MSAHDLVPADVAFALCRAQTARACADAVASLLPALRLVARQKGWALALHGSVARDVDVLAAPWTDDACAPEELAQVLQAVADRYLFLEDHGALAGRPLAPPAAKPHGRLAYVIHLHDGAYLDLSVMPRLPTAAPQESTP